MLHRASYMAVAAPQASMCKGCDGVELGARSSRRSVEFPSSDKLSNVGRDCTNRPGAAWKSRRLQLVGGFGDPRVQPWGPDYAQSGPAREKCLPACTHFFVAVSSQQFLCRCTLGADSWPSRPSDSAVVRNYGRENPQTRMVFRRNCWSSASKGIESMNNTIPGFEYEKQIQYVNWFREAWPYIQGHRGSTFVVVIPGEVIENRAMMDGILQDLALIHGLGIKLVIVPGTHIQIDKLLQERGHKAQYVGAYRITDAPALEASMEAAGRIRVNIEAKLSRGPSIPILRRHGENDRWHEVGVSVTSGNYISAKPRGVVDGIDFGATGEVKKIDVVRIKERLEGNCIVLLSNLGYSGSGEVLNCNTYEVATACATALQADKLLCLLDGPVYNEAGRNLRFMTLQEADQLIRKRASQSYTASDYVKAVAGPGYVKSLGIDPSSSQTPHDTGNGSAGGNTALEPQKRQGFAIGGEERLSRVYAYLSELTAAVYVCRGGVRRVHLVDSHIQGALLLELYSRDGIGTMVSSDLYEGTRSARVSDVASIEELLRPLEESGVLVNRPRKQLLQEIEAYTVVERDGSIIACAALFPYFAEKSGEVAAFAVAPECRGHGRGDNLLDYIEKKAAKIGLEQLFLLTTRTADWFVQRGFSQGSFDAIPAKRRMRVNLARGSKYYLKKLLEDSPSTSQQLKSADLSA